MTDRTRRQALGSLGTGLALLAGCSGSPFGGDDTTTEGTPSGDGDAGPTGGDGGVGALPEFAPALAKVQSLQDVQEDDDLGQFLIAIEGTTLGALGGGESNNETVPDSLLQNPISMGGLGSLLVSFGLGTTAFGQEINGLDSSAEDEGYFLFFNRVFGFKGQFDVAEVGSTLADLEYTEQDVREGQVLYEGADGVTAVGADDEYLLYFSDDSGDVDPVAAIRTHLDALVGEAPLVHETSEDFRFLLESVDTTGLAFATRSQQEAPTEPPLADAGNERMGVVFDFEAFGVPRGVAQSLTGLAGEGAVSVAAGATYPDADAVPADFEANVGSLARSLDVTTDGTDLEVTGTYDRDALPARYSGGTTPS
jgi:hypothetical protein